MYSAFTLTALVLASISSARHVDIKWRPGVEQGGIQWAGDMGPQTAIKIPLTTDGKPIAGYGFTPGIKIDGQYKYPSCKVVGQLNAGLESTSFELQHGADYLQHCNLWDGVAVVCNEPAASCGGW